MAKFRLEPASLKTLQAKLDAYEGKTIQRLMFAMNNWALDTVAEMQKELTFVKAIDQGLLYAATQAKPAVLLGTKIIVVVFNPLEYAVIVEFGRLPGGKPPPLLPLIGWAVRHGIATVLPVSPSLGEYGKELAASAAILRNMGNGGGGGSGNRKPMDPVVLDFLKVRLIAKKIAEQGVAGRHPFSIAWDRKAATFKQDIARLVK